MLLISIPKAQRRPVHPISGKVPNEIANLLVIFVSYQQRLVIFTSIAAPFTEVGERELRRFLRCVELRCIDRRIHPLHPIAITQNVRQARQHFQPLLRFNMLERSLFEIDVLAVKLGVGG